VGFGGLVRGGGVYVDRGASPSSTKVTVFERVEEYAEFD